MHLAEMASLISFLRRKAGLTQVELARHAGVSRCVVQDLEAGTGRTTWKKLAAVLGVLSVWLEPQGALVDQWRKEREEGS